MHKFRPFACNVLNPTQPPFMQTVLASPRSSYTVSTLVSISSPSNNITNILSLGGGTKEVRKILEDCRNDTSTVAPKLLSEAKTGLKTGDYDKAAKSIEYASIPHSCGLKQPSGELQIGEVVEKKTRKRKSKSDNKIRKKPSVETPTEAKDNLLAELNQTTDDAEKEGIIDVVNATSEAIENETEVDLKEKDGDDEAKSEKPKKKKEQRKSRFKKMV
ncbi:hypothetical protein AtEden1_Chr1g0055421 [Arabidopsis thaliana]